MGSEEYYQGRLMESNDRLHNEIRLRLKFDSIKVDGSTRTKGDTFGGLAGELIPISIKNASGMNTQVHITSINKLREELGMDDVVYDIFNRFLGTNDTELFNKWRQNIDLDSYELGHKRLKCYNIACSERLVVWANDVNTRGLLPKLLIQSIDSENPVQYMVWINKKKGGYQIVDVNKLVNYISKECIWRFTPGGTVLECVDNLNNKILWLQMKGNKEKAGYNHAPQFHIASVWPREFIIYEDSNIRF
jgi:hypothetical protein